MNRIELIKKFLRNECSKEEEVLIDGILKEQPDLLDELLTEEEWNRPGPLPDGDNHLREEIWAGIHTALPSRKKILQLWKPLTIAASLILVFGLLYFRLHFVNAVKESTPNVYADIKFKTASNRTRGYLKFSLSDGTLITLYPGAAISYSVNFNTNRKIFLKTGKAAFEVAKDKNHPFTVWARDIATTALGTKFTVADLGKGVDVKLYEGRVVVDAFEKSRKKRSNFLKPGEQYSVSLDKNIPELSTFNGNLNSTIDTSLGVMSNLTPDAIRQGMTMVNTPLNDVFKQLELVYQIKIIFQQHDVSKKYFTGSFSGKETPLEILQIITSINDITVRKNGSDYMIRSQREKAD